MCADMCTCADRCIGKCICVCIDLYAVPSPCHSNSGLHMPRDACVCACVPCVPCVRCVALRATPRHAVTYMGHRAPPCRACVRTRAAALAYMGHMRGNGESGHDADVVDPSHDGSCRALVCGIPFSHSLSVITLCLYEDALASA